MTFYGLVRGREWVCLPRRARIPAGPLVDRAIGEPVWLPGLTLGPEERAWTTTSLELAHERALLLAVLPGGFAVAVRAVGGGTAARFNLWEVGT